MSKRKREFSIPEEEYSTFIGGDVDFQIREIPLCDAERILKCFGDKVQTFVVYGSGLAQLSPEQEADMPDVGFLDGYEVGGIDWVRLEGNRKAQEPPLNVYHFAIRYKNGRNGVDGPLYCVYEGKHGCLAPHWAELDDLGIYFEGYERSDDEEGEEQESSQ